VAPVPVTVPAHDEGGTGPSPLGTGDGRRRWDSSGDVTYDGLNSYLYDAEGRICALQNSVGSITGYAYDAAGIRVAKGSLTSFSCNFAQKTNPPGKRAKANQAHAELPHTNPSGVVRKVRKSSLSAHHNPCFKKSKDIR